MPLRSATIHLPTRRSIDLRALRPDAGDLHALLWRWDPRRRGVLRRAVRLRGGSVYLVTVTTTSRGLVVRAQGRDADQVEQLAPIAAGIRRAFDLDAPRPGGLRGIVGFEDRLLRRIAPLTEAHRLVRTMLAAGGRASFAPRLPALPTPEIIVALGIRRLRDAGAGPAARGIVQLAQRELARVSRLRPVPTRRATRRSSREVPAKTQRAR